MLIINLNENISLVKFNEWKIFVHVQIRIV